MSRSGTNKRRALDRRGSLALETAFVASAFLLMLLGSFEIGCYFFVSESIKYLVGELARGATVAPEKNWDTEKAAYVSRTRILKLADFETLDVVVTPDAAPMPTTIGARRCTLIPARINPDLKPREATPATEAA